MDLYKANLILLLVTLLSAEKTPTSTTEKFRIIMTEKSSAQDIPLLTQNKTIDKLVQEQTDLIKHIVSSHKATTIDYPTVTRTEVEVREDPKLKQEKERQSIEDLRRRCQQLLKLSTNNTSTQTSAERSETKENSDRISTVEAFGPNKKPEFLQKPKVDVSQPPTLPPSFSHPTQVEQMTKNYFIVTRNRTTDLNNQTTTVNKGQVSYKSDSSELKQNVKLQQLITPQITTPPTSQPQLQNDLYPAQPQVKYVHLEPVILQRMILNNGRMLFYWYKSLPAIPHFVSVPRYSPSLQTHPLKVSDIQTHSTQILNTKQYPAQISQAQVYPPEILNAQIYPPQVTNAETQQPQQISNTQQVSNAQKQTHAQSVQVLDTLSSHSQLSQVTNNQNYPSQITNVQTQAIYSTQDKKPGQFVGDDVPKYEIEYGTTEKPEGDLYTKQMKFIIPMQYPSGGDESGSGIRYPWQFDPYAYYPKSLQPTTINVPMPYVPTFHMIKTLRLPENQNNNAPKGFYHQTS